VPALPVIADPENMRVLIEARTGTLCDPAQGTAPGSDPPAPMRCPPKPDFSEQFKDLAFIGDEKLNNLCKRVSVSIWGRQNRRLLKKVQDDWVSNDNWLFLAIVYRLDLFVGTSFRAPTPVTASQGNRTAPGTPTAYAHKILHDPTKPLVKGKQRGKENYAFFKSWADLWEAYFASLIEEREVWHEPLHDIEMFIRQLMVRKYRRLLPFAMNLDVQYTRASDGALGENLARSWVEKNICRSDEVIVSLFGKPTSGESMSPWGRLIVFPAGAGGDNGASDGTELAELERPEMVRAERRTFIVDGYDDRAKIAQLFYGFRQGSEGILPYPLVSAPR